MFYILFNGYFCFYFTFTVYTNVSNALVFMVRKKKEKSNLEANLPPLPAIKTQFFPICTPTIPIPRLLVFDLFSEHTYYSTFLSIRDLTVCMSL